MNEIPDNASRLIRGTSYGGERPLFASRGLRLEQVRILPGESALKECRDIEADRCEFLGKYPFWHNRRLRISHSAFREGARAAIWYGQGVFLKNCKIEAPKALREVDDLELEDLELTDAREALWSCRGVRLKRVRAQGGDYMLLRSQGLLAEDFHLRGEYALQYCRGGEIRDSEIYSKDAFWHAEDVTVYDSVIEGAYLGWYSRRLRLVNCRIAGTQPLCYAEDLVLENCTLHESCDLCFENSCVQATLNGRVSSIKNPISGRIALGSLGELILDEHLQAPGDCSVETLDTHTTI